MAGAIERLESDAARHRIADERRLDPDDVRQTHPARLSGLRGTTGLQLFSTLVALVASLTAACAASGHRPPTVRITPMESLSDQPLQIVVDGLAARRAVTVTLSSRDSQGATFQSNAMYKADGRGHLDVAKAAPISGTYAGVDAMGLVTSMRSSDPTASPLYFWGRSSQTFALDVTQGKTHGHVDFARRGLESGVAVVDETIAARGFFGQYWTPPSSGSSPHAAVLLFGGSEGGLSGQLIASLLASHSYPVLDLAYFKEPSLPDSLANIPLEYFAGALRWLAQQPGVDPRHLIVVSGSRGTEAALLIAVQYSDLVHAVVAEVGANVALSGYPDLSLPAWTLHGRPVPFTKEFNNPAPDDTRAAVIPIETAKPPLLAECGGEDLVVHSCAYGQALVDRLDAAHDQAPHSLVSYPDAGHGIGFPPPFEPGIDAFEASTNKIGRTSRANDAARADFWPRLVAFLDAQSR